MFIDICFPKNNENEFIEIAKKLSTKALCFVYDDYRKIKVLKSTKIKIYNAINTISDKKINMNYFQFSNDLKLISNKKIINYIDETSLKIRNFHIPIKDITQVHMKEYRDKNKILGISFNSIFTKKDNDLIEKLTFIIKLAQKYNVDVFIASFAQSPFFLRSNNELKSFARILKMNLLLIKKNNELLFKHFKN